jgi:beta-galactosidase
MWAKDAREMAALGLTFVRIGEFAWSRIEPTPGGYDWAWLDEAVETLHAAGLSIVMGTPTATPPKWLVDRNPDILAVDASGRRRGFGSRRHYDFSSPAYRAECARIVEAVGARYGRHPGVIAWQTDNEYGCHDTVLSYSPAAAAGFRTWLKRRYGDANTLNQAWGSVFWSQEVGSFAEVDPPCGAVTAPNPSQVLDYKRFASDAVLSFNREQTERLRRLSPGREITHNFMGFFTDFDHYALSEDLDFASWDSYPLGFLEEFWFTTAEKLAYLNRGHPDIAAFHHDLYRGCGRGRFWVMEQQPGPVNWASFNPAPADGMVRLWTLEALAHGAEAVSYFRWRQAPFAQEQMHAGLNRSDGALDQGGVEVRAAASDLLKLGPLLATEIAPAALVFSYEAAWALEAQPQGRGFNWIQLAFEFYGALRRAGLNVDVAPPGADLSGYALVLAPSLPIVSQAALAAFADTDAHVLFGPRSGSRREDGRTPSALAPGVLQDILPFQVTRVESLRPGAEPAVDFCGGSFQGRLWRERLQTKLAPAAVFSDGAPALLEAGRYGYLATWPSPALLDAIVAQMAVRAGVATVSLTEGMRVRRRGDVAFAFNLGGAPQPAPVPPGATMLLGDREVPAGGVSVWRDGRGLAPSPGEGGEARHDAPESQQNQAP